jgi:phosphatidylglycerol:prolipoprotein diacylglycerol transferase
MSATIWGFVGAKIYYLLEQLPNFDVHHLGGMGFTWYGGLIGGVMAALFIVHRRQLPLGIVAGAAAVRSPLPTASAGSAACSPVTAPMADPRLCRGR